MRNKMNKTKLSYCPFCNSKLISKESENLTDNIICNTNSEEHILPKSLGNNTLILQKVVYVTNATIIMQTNIERPFMEIKSIQLLRSYHLIPNRKNKIPPIQIGICGEEAQMEFDNNSKAFIIKVNSQVFENIISEKHNHYFVSKTINIKEFENNYIVSRFLIKVFLEINIFYYLEWVKNTYNADEELYFEYDEKLKELTNYLRLGKKDKIYNYKVRQTKPIEFFQPDNFVADIELKFNSDKTLSGMILKLFEIEFQLSI